MDVTAARRFLPVFVQQEEQNIVTLRRCPVSIYGHSISFKKLQNVDNSKHSLNELARVFALKIANRVLVAAYDTGYINVTKYALTSA